ncbi:PREDICTED: ATP-dependent DNA helicase PIF1-like [Erythranthe guttata]|uniref:ATP-dependent DNA helicase PIF1-like n=1 Tax=Erythranthe guttata TaxID=4155 RepID=UPI00064DE9E3|nr:PREDICTED: ATP-dependent DNA helicase PIF1-like [Erythranthe guttata]|eukprot:XP_012841546.1 PREDICTED: ATP-dependent DNA helicase PIF1-like [Erythranthe guttata]
MGKTFIWKSLSAAIRSKGEIIIDVASSDPFLDLIEFVYPDLVTNLFIPEYFEGRAILAPTNESVEIFTPEIPNTISCFGIPPYKLTLKRGVPVMLIRNIDQARGLCNGTRLHVINMGKHVLNCMIPSGKHVGDSVYIPRMTLVPSNYALPIKFQGRQFPLMVSFAMTINKSQGQIISHVGVYLPRPVFSHGQLYVVLSRVKSRSGIKILINSESGDTTNITNNVVYTRKFFSVYECLF